MMRKFKTILACTLVAFSITAIAGEYADPSESVIPSIRPARISLSAIKDLPCVFFEDQPDGSRKIFGSMEEAIQAATAPGEYVPGHMMKIARDYGLELREIEFDRSRCANDLTKEQAEERDDRMHRLIARNRYKMLCELRQCEELFRQRAASETMHPEKIMQFDHEKRSLESIIITAESMEKLALEDIALDNAKAPKEPPKRVSRHFSVQ